MRRKFLEILLFRPRGWTLEKCRLIVNWNCLWFIEGRPMKDKMWEDESECCKDRRFSRRQLFIYFQTCIVLCRSYIWPRYVHSRGIGYSILSVIVVLNNVWYMVFRSSLNQVGSMHVAEGVNVLVLNCFDACQMHHESRFERMTCFPSRNS